MTIGQRLNNALRRARLGCSRRNSQDIKISRRPRGICTSARRQSTARSGRWNSRDRAFYVETLWRRQSRK